MGTYLKIAPQGAPVEFTTVNTTNVYSTTVTTDNVISDTAAFTTASGYFEGTFSGSYIGLPTSSLDGHNFTTPFYLTASKGYLSFVDNGALTLVSTGSVSNIFLIQDATGSAFTINNQGVTVLKTFYGSAPTPIQGGIYFDSYDMYIGIDDLT